jgi:hypothetical protein
LLRDRRCQFRHLLPLLLCGCQPEVVVGKGADPNQPWIVQELAAAPFPCLEPAAPGPSGYGWCRIADSPAQVSWVAPLTPDQAHVSIDGPESAWAGVAFEFDPEARVGDVSVFDELALDTNVGVDEPFEIVVGRGREVGCVYSARGQGRGTTAVDLRSAFWCWPSLCNYDLRASGGAVRVPYMSGGALDVEVFDVQWLRTGAGAGSSSGLSAAIGPGGLCWFTFGWDGGAASWVTPPSSSAAHVLASAAEPASAGLGFEVPGAPADWSTFARVEIDATVAAGVAFHVQVVTSGTPRGCTWDLVGAGRTTYLLDLQNPPACWGDPPFDLRGAARVEIGYGGGNSSEILVAAVRIVP